MAGGFSATRRGVLALLGALGLLVSCAAGKGAAHAVSDHPLLGAPAREIQIPTAEGAGQVALGKHAGKVVIIDFWATWCEPCRLSFPAYQKLIEDFRGRLLVIGVSVDEDPSGIAAFLRETGAKFQIGWDEGQSAAQSYQPPKMPTSFIVDANGIVRFVHAGWSAGDEAEIQKQVQSLL